MIELALLEPEIPPNTGNLIRLMANIGSKLHLIEPLGFLMDDKKLRRAGLDYHELAEVIHHPSQDHFFKENTRRIIACETNGKSLYTEFNFEADDIILMGPETRGLDEATIAKADASVYIPMKPHCRSINLSNAAAIVIFEAWRQLKFCNL